MAGVKWTTKENQLLRTLYFDCELEKLLLSFPIRNWNSIKIQARKLGLSRDNFAGRSGDLTYLLGEDLQVYYWIGFLLADGHFQKRGKMSFRLAKKDKERVYALAEELNCSVHECKVSFGLGVMHQDICYKIAEKFGISNNKTENPPSTLIQKEDEKTLALLVGFIDGDGYIKNQFGRKDSIIQLKMHSSWLPILVEVENFLFKYFKIEHKKHLSKINNQGYASLIFSNNRIVRGLKNFVLEKKLSVLNRKWDLIDETLVQRLTLDEQKQRVYNFIKDNPNASRKEICKLLGICKTYLSKLLT